MPVSACVGIRAIEQGRRVSRRDGQRVPIGGRCRMPKVEKPSGVAAPGEIKDADKASVVLAAEAMIT